MRGRCATCRAVGRAVATEAEWQLFRGPIRALWEGRGISFETKEEEPTGIDVPDSDDPWLELLASWIATDRPVDVTIEAGLAVVGISRAKASAEDRDRVRTIFTVLGREVSRRRFAGPPQATEAVSKVMPLVKDPQRFTCAEVIALLEKPHSKRWESIVGRALAYLGYEQFRPRRATGGRENAYRKPPP